MRKLAMLLSLGAASVALAEGETPSTMTFDLSKASQAASTIGTNLSNLITGDVLTNALLVLSALVVLWVIFKIPRWIGAGHK